MGCCEDRTSGLVKRDPVSPITTGKVVPKREPLPKVSRSMLHSALPDMAVVHPCPRVPSQPQPQSLQN